MPNPSSLRKVYWMACAMILARDSAGTFDALIDLVQSWREQDVCALSDRLAPTPGIAKDRINALAALRAFSQRVPPDVAARIRMVGREIAQMSGVFGA